MRKHPDILELRERFRPLSNIYSFARNKISSRTEVKEVLSDDVVYQLIMEFLAEEHLDSSLQILEKETNSKSMLCFLVSFSFSSQLNIISTGITGEVESQALETLLKIGIRDVKNLFDPQQESTEPDPEVEAYRTYVYDRGGMNYLLSSLHLNNNGGSS
jgi:hypothetical protein